jgi:flagellar FliJ protein
MAKKFRFSLEALLKLRTLEEERAMQELGKVIEKMNQAKQKVKELEDQYNAEVKKFSEYSRMATYTLFYQSFERFLNRIENLKKQTEVYVQSLQPELEEKRQKLIEARKNKKILEILKEKRWEEYKNKLKKQETKELFELNQKLLKETKGYEHLEQTQTVYTDFEDESKEDLKSRRERELREYYRKQGIPFTEI